jgi:hypothetical protein
MGLHGLLKGYILPPNTSLWIISEIPQPHTNINRTDDLTIGNQNDEGFLEVLLHRQSH